MWLHGYISEQFRSMGVKEVEGTKDYFQILTLKSKVTATAGALTINNTTFEIGKDLVQVNGEDVLMNAPVKYSGYHPDTSDVKGKIMIINFGTGESSSFMDGWESLHQGRNWQRKKARLP